jgi:hypothetical protein
MFLSRKILNPPSRNCALSMLCFHAGCPCYVSMPHVLAACPCCMFLLHVHVACPCSSPCCVSPASRLRCMSMLHVHATCSVCMSMLYVCAQCPSARPCCMSCPRCMFMVHVFKIEMRNKQRNLTKN